MERPLHLSFFKRPFMRTFLLSFFQAKRPLLLAGLLSLSPALYAASPDIIINGVEGALKTNVKAHNDFSSEKCDLPTWRARGIERRATENSKQALQALGYYDAKIKAAYQDTDECWEVIIDIQQGKPVLLTNVHLTISGEANHDKAFDKVRKHEALKIGQPIEHNHYESVKAALIQTAADRGYLKSELVDHRLEIDLKKHSAEVYLALESGPRYHFRHVSFEQDILHQSLADKFIPIDEGEMYESHKLIRFQQSLSSSGYYRNVRVQSETDHDERAVDVKGTAEPRPRHGYMAGIGYSTDVGPRVRFGFENRRANKKGHRYENEIEASEMRTEYRFKYDIPLGDPHRERVSLGAGYKRKKTKTSESELYRAGIAYIRELDSGWVATPFLDFEREHFTVADEKNTTNLVMPGFDLSRTRANHPLYPTRGWRVNSQIRVADENLASTVSFVQLTGSGKAIHPLAGGRILVRLEGGATLADSVTRLPASVRFFAGGDHSLRGYGFERVGPRNDNGDVIGGRHRFTSTVEYDRLFTKTLAWAVFVDGGNAYDSLDDFEMLYGYGAGLRWRSPIGPIRFDVAVPSDGPDNFRIHISMGPDL